MNVPALGRRALMPLALLLCLMPSVAAAAQSLVVKNAWARASAPGQTSASVYLEITSNAPAALIAAASPRARGAEFHAMSVEGGVMRMRAVSRIELSPGKTVKLGPGGLHVMLTGLGHPLRENEKLPLTLTVEDASGAKSTVGVEAEIRPLTAAGTHSH